MILAALKQMQNHTRQLLWNTIIIALTMMYVTIERAHAAASSNKSADCCLQKIGHADRRPGKANTAAILISVMPLSAS